MLLSALKPYTIFMSLLVFLSACSPADKSIFIEQNTSQITITGEITGYDHQPMAQAIIEVTPLVSGSDKNFQQINVDTSGAYSAILDKNQRYLLMVAGVGHMPMKLLLDATELSDANLDLSLDAITYLTAPETVAVKLLTADGSQASHALEVQDDGSFAATIALDAGEVKYQLRGISKAKMSIENPRASSFEYDNGGNFYSVIEHKGGNLVIRYNPAIDAINAESLLAGQQISSSFAAKQNKDLTLMAQYNRLLIEQRLYLSDIQRPPFVYPEGLETIKAWQADPQYAEQAQLLLAMSTAIHGQPYSLFQQTLAEIASESWLWSLPEVSFATSLRLAGMTSDELEYHQGIINQADTLDQKVQHFLSDNPNDDAKAELLMILAYSYRRGEMYEQYDKYYQMLLADYAHVKNFERFKTILQPKSLPIGQPSPEFAIKDITDPDTSYNKASFANKVYLLDFWATWCVPCIKEMPDLHQAYSKYNDKGFEILSLSADDSIADIKKFRQGDWAMPWKHGFLDDRKHPMIKDYMVFGYPVAYLIDENGAVLASGDKVRGKRLSKTLSIYFDKKNAAKG
ncbi:hypothetical protein tinsulaeT_30820 [Thalassotalea insulae]|uniref:Thioredoxin domain-containing protein n=1 Tax=Thalassotalea insulae TaxID=2056778 RepID=A0ABQ6GYT3_9GAMM|nr:TlpA disulfide reductase family protein [Thalassotalea insulae]GLX79742.1 hypothetical protein tinsulaeT_30820 [Thalassotalea insulae]